MLDLTKYKRRGLIGTAIFHILMILLFIFSGFRTALPLPEEEGLLINFGNSADGFGQIEPMSSQKTQPQENIQEQTDAITHQNTTAASTEKVETQNIEESITAPDVSEVSEESNEEVEEKVEERKANPFMMFSPKDDATQASSGEGVTEGASNQGREDGSVNSSNRTGNGTGNNGIGFNLTGRNASWLPKPVYNSDSQGKVVVEIKVDRDGKVISATPIARGSNTSDPALWEAAKQAALKATFDKKHDAQAYQKGTITYNFILR